MLDGNFRKSVETVTLPTGRWLVRFGFSADVLTFSGLVFSIATAFMIAFGHFWIAIVLLTLTGFHDLFDGPVAKASKRASQRGAFFDSVVDRITDSLLLGGVAYYLTAHHHGQLVLLPFAILTTTYMISYQRSKAESLGMAAKGGLMERAERMILLGIGMLAKPIFIPVLWIMLALTFMTAAGRFWRIWQIAASPEPPMMQAGRIHHHSSRLRRGLSRTSRS
ncbi:MAG TPA: CDP-alcohol phosphatidyltransferase family protein [Acidimicrobiales bacterium]